MMQVLRATRPNARQSVLASALGQRAWKSTAAEAASVSSATTSPSMPPHAAPTTTTAEVIELKRIPSLPFIGSLVHQYSGIPKMDTKTTFDFWPELRRRYGDFYSIGIPGLGAGRHGTLHIVQDPVEMMKVLRSEGKFPTSVVELQHSLVRKFTADGNSLLGIFQRGPAWKRIRTFLQKDMLSPQSANRYIPGIVKAAEHAR
jgi:hypothetical protein